MAKYVLNNSPGDLDFALIGLVCAENQYSLVSEVNNALNIDLALSDNVPYNLKDGKLFYFSLFHFISEEFGLEYYLIPNNSNLETEIKQQQQTNDLFAELNVDESTKLIKELPKTDYFLILKGEDLHMFQYKVIEKLKTIKDIIQVQSIEPGDLPSRMNLVF